jgi:hypothetical protein
MVGKSRYHLEKQANRGFRGYPLATVAFYGPTSDFASKVAVAIFRAENEEAEVLERFFSAGSDARFDEAIGSQSSRGDPVACSQIGRHDGSDHWLPA